jgi:ATP-dependent exoDNAse (exonuclease V) beta subunit
MNQAIFKNAVLKLNLEDSAYRQDEGVSQSELKPMLISPAHYKAEKEAPREETDAMRLGTATHIAAFQLEHFHNEVVQAPKFDKRTNAGKEGWQRFQHENAGKLCLSEEHYADCIGMAESVRNIPLFRTLIQYGSPEVSIFAEHSSGINVKGRLDWLNDTANFVLDLKTIGKEANEYNICNTIKDRGYDFQAAYYMQLLNAVLPDRVYRFVFCFVESTAPYGVRFVEVNPLRILNKVNDIDTCLRQLSKARASGIWDGYKSEILTIDI